MYRTKVAGYGCVPIGEHWDSSLLDLGVAAIQSLSTQGNVSQADVLVVGNMLAGSLNHQENLATAIADRAGLSGIETMKVEAACASGAAAVKAGFALISSGLAKRVIVLGLEKMTDRSAETVTSAISQANDFEAETIFGATSSSLVAMLSQVYTAETDATERDLSFFAVNAYRNATATPWSMFKGEVTQETWDKSQVIIPPLRLLDCPANSDGAAAIILERMEDDSQQDCIEVLASNGASDVMAIANRPQMLRFAAVEKALSRSLELAGVTSSDIDVFELHDAFPVVAAICLEAAGYAKPGEGWRYGGDIESKSRPLPAIQTMGGIKGKGHPLGATGIYQIVDACTQLAGKAGVNQIHDATTAMTLALGGLASTAYATVLRKSKS